MRRLLIFFAVLTWISPALASTLKPDSFGVMPPRIVENDDGGVIGPYLMRIGRSIRLGQQVIIRGMCASACTYELNSHLHCVTPQSRFFFHATTTDPYNRSYREQMLALYSNPRLVSFIRSHGGLTPDGWYTTGAELAANGAAKLCE